MPIKITLKYLNKLATSSKFVSKKRKLNPEQKIRLCKMEIPDSANILLFL